MISEATRSALEALAAEASLAIENARLYREQQEKLRIEQELRVAARIQRSLLPDERISLPYLDAAAASEPCRSIGGDFFDYPRQASPSFGFTVGDVAGKGPPAALMSAMLQGIFAAVSREQFAAGPAAVVRAINAALCQRALDVRFVTLFLGTIDEDGTLTYCNAGHCQPLVVGNAGVRRLDVGGPVCGLFETAPYEQTDVTLEPGDAIVVYSDGVTDAVDPAEQEFGETRLLQSIQQAADGSAQALVDAVIDAVNRHAAGAAQSDDVTIMAIRYRGASRDSA
jgi:sigma-B regulation protein RsbU (phosphoserine phosphatase)